MAGQCHDRALRKATALTFGGQHQLSGITHFTGQKAGDKERLLALENVQCERHCLLFSAEEITYSLAKKKKARVSCSKASLLLLLKPKNNNDNKKKTTTTTQQLQKLY